MANNSKWLITTLEFSSYLPRRFAMRKMARTLSKQPTTTCWSLLWRIAWLMFNNYTHTQSHTHFIFCHLMWFLFWPYTLRSGHIVWQLSWHLARISCAYSDVSSDICSSTWFVLIRPFAATPHHFVFVGFSGGFVSFFPHPLTLALSFAYFFPALDLAFYLSLLRKFLSAWPTTI